MNEAQIEELFIRAAEVDRKLPNTARPSSVKSMDFGAIHSFADMNQWGEERLHEAQWSWLDPENLRLTKNDVGLWIVSMEVIKLCPCPDKRRALLAWARTEAGGKSFARWCKKVEGVSRQLGYWRKERAVEQIALTFRRKALLHNDPSPESDFTNGPEISDKTVKLNFWRPDDAKPICRFDEELEDFSYYERQKEIRRQREARKREREAA
jgi:hypothetical protein